MGVALAVGLPVAAAVGAAAQSGPSGPSGPSGGATTTQATTATTVATTRSSTGGGTLSRTGGDWALPLAASGAAIAVVLGGRRLGARSVQG